MQIIAIFKSSGVLTGEDILHRRMRCNYRLCCRISSVDQCNLIVSLQVTAKPDLVYEIGLLRHLAHTVGKGLELVRYEVS